MTHPTRQRRGPHCKTFFHPDHRNVTRGRYGSKPECRQANKAASQRRWLEKPGNRHHFRDPDHVKRVQLWRQDHPGYWRHKTPEGSAEPDALQETLTPQEIETQSVNESLATPGRDALQGSFFMQPAVLVGLIAQLSGWLLLDSRVLC